MFKLKREQTARLFPVLLVMLSAAILLLLVLVIVLVTRDPNQELPTPQAQARTRQPTGTIPPEVQVWLELTASRTPSSYDLTYSAAQAVVQGLLATNTPTFTWTPSFTATFTPVYTKTHTPTPRAEYPALLPPTPSRIPAFLTANPPITVDSASQLVELAKFQGPAGFDFPNALVWSPDSTVLAAGGNRSVFLYDTAVPLWDSFRQLEHPQGTVASLAYSLDGAWLAVGLNNGSLWMWDTATWQTVYTQHEYDAGGLISLSFNATGTLLAAGYTQAKSARLYDVATGSLLAISEPITETLAEVVFNSDSGLLALRSSQDLVTVHETSTWTILATLTAPKNVMILSMAFSPGGTELAYGRSNGEILFWSKLTEENSHSLFLRSAAPDAIAFSPDGTLLASAGVNNPPRVWDITGKKVLTVLDVTATIRTLAFSPDGRFLAGRDETGRIYIWGIPVTAN